MIVRVMGEGQFEIDDEVAKGLNELDEQAEQALAGGRPGAARGAAGADGRGACARTARELPDEDLSPPRRSSRRRDLTLEEAHELFDGEGLIRTSPAA